MEGSKGKRLKRHHFCKLLWYSMPQVFSDLSEELLSLDEVTTLLFYRKRFLSWQFRDNLKSDFFFTLIYTYTSNTRIHFPCESFTRTPNYSLPQLCRLCLTRATVIYTLQVFSYSFTYIYICNHYI